MAWESYLCRLAGRPAVVAVDTSYTAADATRSKLFYAMATLRVPDDEGLPIDADEAEDLLELEEALELAVAPRGVVFVGRVSTASRHELYFYGPGTEGFEVFAAIIAEFDEMEIDLGAHDDPDWSHYFGVLLPPGTGSANDGLPRG